jgi:dUTP diphosphatase
MVTIQFKKLSENATVPTRGSDFAAGYDLYATEDYTLQPLERKLFKTGIAMAIASGLYGRIAPRSGLAYKNGIDTMAGVIDEDYRGDVGVILINLGDKPFEVKVGNKIAQIIFEHYNPATFQEVAELPTSVRAEGGFGSTDKKIGWIAGELKPVVDQTDRTIVGTVVGGVTPGKSLAEMYHKTGGVPVKKRYSEEIKERDQAS